MKLRHILSIGCLAATATVVCAQDLEKEITIDRDIVPAQRAAARPVVFPGVTVPTVTPVSLTMEDSRQALPVSPSLNFYEPARDAGMFPATPWRGYVDLGYFPTVDFGVSAGYSILDKEATKLNVWLQADNRNYDSPTQTVTDDFKWKTFDITGGFGFSQLFGKHNILRLSTDLGYSSWSSPQEWLINGQKFFSGDLHEDPDKNLSNFRWHLGGDFSGRGNDQLTYGFGAAVGLFHNQKQEVEWVGGTPDYYPEAINDMSVSFNARVRHQFSGHVGIGIKAEGDFIRYSSFYTPEMLANDISRNPATADPGSKTVGHIAFTPAVEYNGGSFYGKAGARLGVSFNSGNTFHVAPDIILGINPSASFGAWLKFGGGVQTNSLESVFQKSRFADSRLAYNLSNLAFSTQVGVRVGPFKGASLTLTADYAAANDWLMPFQQASLTDRVYNMFAPSRIRAWKFGARIDWQYRSLVTVALSYECVPADTDDRAWIDWYDRARHVAGASVSVKPISPLTIDLGFTARLDRAQWIENPGGITYINDQDYIITEPYAGSYDLGDLTNLWAGASWRFTPALTVFARFDNILDKHSAQVFNVPTQGFTGLFGIGYKF